MKTNVYFFTCLIFGTSLFSNAQTTDPDQWADFITNNNNTLVSDTFRMLRFEDSLPDNWTYRTEGNCELVNASDINATGTSMGTLLKMGLGSSLYTEAAQSLMHQSITGTIVFTANGLMKGEHMNLTLHHGETQEVKRIEINTNNYSIDFKHVDIKNRVLHGIDIQISQAASNTQNGYYAFDSLYLCGQIPTYSLFEGEGNWRDTARWSHLPAERHRHALVQGSAVLSEDTHCDQVSLAGQIRVQENSTFSLRDLNLYGTSSTLQNTGKLLVGGCVSLTRTFPEKGVWYFVSFPFDVYPDGLDPAFSLKDDTPNAGGNYIYLLSYDGESRNNGQLSQSNWTVIPESAKDGESPIFEKNKGYLIAIDEAAEQTTLRFTSREGVIPNSFGKSGEIAITIPYEVGENNRHGGWFLCGNPLPAPIAVSEFAHPDLDGYVYLYNGTDYTRIAIDEAYSLPPYSAFFLKARQSVQLTVEADKNLVERTLLSTHSPLRTWLSEPSTNLSTENTVIDESAYRMTRSLFQISRAPEKGSVHIYDISGKHIFTQNFAAGESRDIPLPLQTGLYILTLKTENRRTEYKFVR